MNRSDNTKQALIGIEKASVQQFTIGENSSSDNLSFSSFASGNFIFSGGSVGIGTTTASSTLTVNGTISGSIAANFSHITATVTEPGGSLSAYTASSWVSCPAGTTLIMKSLIACTGANSNTYQYCNCVESGNSIKAEYLSSDPSANANYLATCEGLCVK